MFRHLRTDSLVCKALYKYKDWQVSILHTVKTRDEASRIEIEEIRNFNSVAPNGYNLIHGGEGGDTFSGKYHTKESKEKIRSSNTGKKNPEVSKALTGIKLSKDHIDKISNSLIGNKYGRGNRGKSKSEETKAKMSIAATGKNISIKKVKRMFLIV